MTLEEMMKVAEALGLGPEATLDDFLSAIDTMKPGQPAPEDDLPLKEDPPKPEDEDAPAAMAAASRLCRLADKTTIGAAVAEVEIWQASHVALEGERLKLAKDREALELSHRKANAAQLIKLGAETPHTSGLATGKLCGRLVAEPLDEQTARCAALLAARGGKLPPDLKPPAAADEVTGLSAREKAMCAEMKIEPAAYVAKRDANPTAKAS